MSLYDSQGDAIQVWESEREAGYVHPDLDLDYIDGLAADLASILQTEVAEAVYQPGDGTRYPLVIVPLAIVRAGRPRVKNGVAWERHAASGMVGMDAREREAEDGSGYYGEGGYLVSWVERTCYQTRLQNRDLAAVYVAEHWGCSLVSACSLAILLRAVGHYLDKWDELDASRTASDRRKRIRAENTEPRDG